MRPAITFDFHNTLIRCDPWFDLEVAGLPGAVSHALWESGAGPDPQNRQEMTEVYRALRAEVIDHGNELDATEGVLETFRRMGYVVQSDAVRPIVDRLFLTLVAESEVIDGVRDTLGHIAELGIPVGIVSSAVHHDFLEWTLEHHGLRAFFADVTTSASSGYYKSRPEIFRVACERLGVAPDHTIHVGDSFRFDHLGGSAAGLRTIWFNQAGVDRPDGGPQPDLVLDSLVGAGPLIAQLLAVPVDAR
ncbi:MAG TPA: HAD family hydrolase [Thermomicrobiales bacterium]|nr:HAD family hydrolase [Thermomicrobiales bacterium]